ncbi:hypothetical protein ACWD4X_30620 [Streptomyces termitum]
MTRTPASVAQRSHSAPKSGHRSGPVRPPATPSQTATGACTARAIMNQIPLDPGWRT